MWYVTWGWSSDNKDVKQNVQLNLMFSIDGGLNVLRNKSSGLNIIK